ncbi:MAG TPA: aspartate 1-decarboxylase [Candidatus Dormibacteraeota bacterium]|nr:aspartate 1-decarboxylase [Candidatus Dormibacteraeota bacterium]
MQRIVMKSKIHRATVTRADLHYEGSCSIDTELMRAADIVVGEQLHIVNVTNGSRAITYAIEGAPGEVALNGAMAHIGDPGDTVILITYAQYDDAEVAAHTPRVVQVDASNRACVGGKSRDAAGSARGRLGGSSPGVIVL